MAMGRRLGGKEGEKLETAGMMRWLLTYADMITLLLALFIILFSISTINKVKLQRLVRDLGGGFAAPDALNNPPSGQTENVRDDLKAMQQQIQSYIKQNSLQNKVQAQIQQNGKKRELIISLLTDKALYESGKADLKPETQKIVHIVGQQLKPRGNQVRIEGFTDNVPIHNEQFDSNWELSAARASNVLRYLADHDNVKPDRLSLAGYGEFRPKFPNDTEAHRSANRRVDIVIVDTDQNAAAVNAAAASAAGAAGEGQ